VGLFEPKKMEALSALGLMNSLTDQQEMGNHVGAPQALCEECAFHADGVQEGGLLTSI